MAFFKSIKLSGFLSFPPATPALDLAPLNVLIGPNGSGKSNFLDAFDLLHATPRSLATFLREGEIPQEWLWNGKPAAKEGQP
jgi:predicted ATPase